MLLTVVPKVATGPPQELKGLRPSASRELGTGTIVAASRLLMRRVMRRRRVQGHPKLSGLRT